MGIYLPPMESANPEPKSKPTCRLCGTLLTAESSYQNPCPSCLKNEPTTLLQRFDEVDRKALKLELGFDETLEEYFVVKDAGNVIGKEWEGYRFECFGVIFGKFSQLFDWKLFNKNFDEFEKLFSDDKAKKKIKAIRDMKKTPAKLTPFSCIHIQEEPDLMVVLCRIRVFYKDDPFYSEMIVHAFGVRRVSIQGLERSKSKSGLDRVWKGLEILRRVDKNYGGRKKGSTSLSLNEFRRRSIWAYKNYSENTGSVPTDLDIASSINISSASFYRYLSKCKWTMQKLREEAEKVLEEN